MLRNGFMAVALLLAGSAPAGAEEEFSKAIGRCSSGIV